MLPFKEDEMLDGYIIEQLQKIEQERAKQERERARLPIPTSQEGPNRSNDNSEPEVERGVVVIEFSPALTF
jgi:hypothetical protein